MKLVWQVDITFSETDLEIIPVKVTQGKIYVRIPENVISTCHTSFI